MAEIILIIVGAVAVFASWRMKKAQKQPITEIEYMPTEPIPQLPAAPVSPVVPQVAPEPVQTPTAPYLTSLVPWTSQKNNFHNARVICDQEGLDAVQKNVLCACIYQESEFLVNPKPNQNKDKNGKTWSTDYGIIQVNDHYNIGSGKPFPSVQYVLDNPEACVRWMVKYYKKTSGLSLWASWTSGVYRKWLEADSPMWSLKT